MIQSPVLSTFAVAVVVVVVVGGVAAVVVVALFAAHRRRGWGSSSSTSRRDADHQSKVDEITKSSTGTVKSSVSTTSSDEANKPAASYVVIVDGTEYVDVVNTCTGLPAVNMSEEQDHTSVSRTTGLDFSTSNDIEGFAECDDQAIAYDGMGVWSMPVGSVSGSGSTLFTPQMTKHRKTGLVPIVTVKVFPCVVAHKL